MCKCVLHETRDKSNTHTVVLPHIVKKLKLSNLFDIISYLKQASNYFIFLKGNKCPSNLDCLSS